MILPDSNKIDKVNKSIFKAAMSIGVSAQYLLDILDSLPKEIGGFAPLPDLSKIMENYMDENEIRQAGFICINGSNTWLPKPFYEARKYEQARTARQVQRLFSKPVRKSEKKLFKRRINMRKRVII